jgi:hypothetical protein
MQLSAKTAEFKLSANTAYIKKTLTPSMSGYIGYSRLVPCTVKPVKFTTFVR